MQLSPYSIITSGLFERCDFVIGRESLKCIAEACFPTTQGSQRQRAGRGQTLQLQHTLTFLSEIAFIKMLRLSVIWENIKI